MLWKIFLGTLCKWMLDNQMQGTYQGASATRYGGVCTASYALTASDLAALMTWGGFVGNCTQSPGVTPVAAPLTVDTVSSAATTGSVGGSIAGSLIAAIIGWLVQNAGPIILKFLMGKMYDETKAKIEKWRNKHSAVAHADESAEKDLERGTNAESTEAKADGQANESRSRSNQERSQSVN